jgi:hypothetical protein
MEAMIAILREVRDARDGTARHDVGDMLFASEAVARWASGMCRRCRGNALEVAAEV